MRQRNPNKPKFKCGQFVKFKKRAFQIKGTNIYSVLYPSFGGHQYWIHRRNEEVILVDESQLKAISTEEAFLLSL